MKQKIKETASAKGAADEFRLEEFLPFRLAVASNQVSRLFMRSYVQEFGLTIPEWRVLAAVGRFVTLSPSGVGDWTRSRSAAPPPVWCHGA